MKTLPPNVLKNNHHPSKKARALVSAPEVHIMVNIAPIPGAGSSAMHESFITTNSPVKQSMSVPGPAKVSDTAMHSLSCSAPPTTPLLVSHEPPNPLSCKSLLLLLLDCIESLRIPSTLELLSYMDADEPTPDLKYVNVHSELYDHEVEDIVLWTCTHSPWSCFQCLGVWAESTLFIFANMLETSFLSPSASWRTLNLKSKALMPFP
jgi:hypothetical protein